MGVTKQQFTEHTGDVLSVSVLPSVDPNIFVSSSCDALAKVSSLANATDKLLLFPLYSYFSIAHVVRINYYLPKVTSASL